MNIADSFTQFAHESAISKEISNEKIIDSREFRRGKGA